MLAVIVPLLLISFSGLVHSQYGLTDPDLIGDIFGQQEGINDELLCIEEGKNQLCSGKGTCEFGMCTCDAGYSGNFCEIAPARLIDPNFDMCATLRPCVECMVFHQYWKHFDSAFQCKQHCESNHYEFKMGPKPGPGDQCSTNEDCAAGECQFLADAYCECVRGYCEVRGGLMAEFQQPQECSAGQITNKLEGDSWVCEDGCNTCRCSRGKVLNTQMWCPPVGDDQCQDFPHDGKVRKDGEMWSCPDGCNTCTCNKGTVERTERFCQQYGQQVFTRLIPLDVSTRSAEECRFHGNLDGDSICPEYTFQVEEKNGKDVVYVERPPCLADDLAVNDAVWRGEKGEKDGHQYAHGWGDLQYSEEDHLNRDKYQGHMEWGQKHGYGTLSWKDGTVFSGQFKEDAKDGEGTLFYTNGDVYTGLWQQEKKSGAGQYVYNQGGSYMGQFSEGMKDGEGVDNFRNEDPLGPHGNDWEVFEGTFSGNQRATGQFKLSQGNIFQGEFASNNLFTGSGVYVWACGKKYEGDFVDGHPHGEGVMTHPEGWSYQGHFQGGKFHGQGTFSWTDNNKFEGVFSNGEMTGEGDFWMEDGGLFDFSNGLFYPDRNDRSVSYEAQFDGKKLRKKKPVGKGGKGGY